MLKLKYLSLFVLVFQNTALVLTLRYSRTVQGPRYLVSTAVTIAEGAKVLVCLLVILYNNGIIATLNILKTEWTLARLVKVSVPAILYTVQNNLLYIALSHLDAATYQVTYQLKILTTALFSVLMLKKSLSRVQWGSLVILMVAVALVQMPSNQKESSESSTSSTIGLAAILVACLTSGFAGVYTELLLKSDNSIWVKSMQLSFVSMVTSLIGVFLSDWSAVMESGFLQGYSMLVWIVILLQALGGLVIAMVMKYADNILKGFAASISIVLSCLVSYVLLEDLTLSILFVIGSALVIVSTVLYGLPGRPAGGSKQSLL
eukprot:Em0013g156a